MHAKLTLPIHVILDPLLGGREGGGGLTRLGALGNLDFQLICVGEELGGHTEASTGHLFDAAGGQIARLQPVEVWEALRTPALDVRERLPARGVFPSLSRVALACWHNMFRVPLDQPDDGRKFILERPIESEVNAKKYKFSGLREISLCLYGFIPEFGLSLPGPER